MGVRTGTSRSAALAVATLWGALAALAGPVVLAGPLTAPAAAEVAAEVPAATSGAELPARRTQAQGAEPSFSPALRRIRVVDHNIEKRSAAMSRALTAARKTGAEVILLQEVCWWQADQLRRRHPTWTVAYKPERERDKCMRGSSRDSGLLGVRRQVGNVAIWTGGSVGLPTTHTFTTQRVKSDRTGLACVSWTTIVRHRACSVHLISPTGRRELIVRTKQAREVRRITGPWVGKQDLVVLGGDFNAEPQRATMNHLYRFDGVGRFREATKQRLGGPDCRCRQVTGDERRAKVDYIFFSANRTTARGFRSLRVVKTSSDHHLLIGWADMDVTERS